MLQCLPNQTALPIFDTNNNQINTMEWPTQPGDPTLGGRTCNHFDNWSSGCALEHVPHLRRGRPSGFTEEQIIGALKEVDAGVKVGDVCRRIGVTEKTFYRWRTKFSGMDVSDARRLRQLEDENARLKRIVAEQALDKRPRFGYRRLHVLLRRQGVDVNHKRVYRVIAMKGSRCAFAVDADSPRRWT